MHIELLLNDSVVMISGSTEDYPAMTTMLHMYVPNVHKTFELAIANDCMPLEQPTSEVDNPDTRGAFMDYAGNYWAINTQKE